MRVLILGGTGVISYYVTKKYRDMGHQVTVFNRGNRKELNIEGVEYVMGNANSCDGLLEGIGERFYDKILDFVTYDKDIMQMKVGILKERCTHFIFISSVAVYERKKDVESYTEEMDLGNSEWPYGRKKSECEQILQETVWNQKDSYYTIIRPGLTCGQMFIPYSPVDSYNMPGYLIHCILTRKEILTTDEGEDEIQVMWSTDFADNLYTLLNYRESRNECFNLCGDEYITSNQILQGLSACLGVPAAVCYVPRSEFVGKTDMEPIVEGGWHDLYSNRKVKKVLGETYCVTQKVMDNLQKAVDFFLCHYERIGWSEITENQILEVIKEAKRNGKANIRYISAQENKENNWGGLYRSLDCKIREAELLSEKRRVNEEYLAKWMGLEIRQIHLASYFCERGIKRICLYGYGVLGRHVVKALENFPVEILCVIDRGENQQNDNLVFSKSAAGMEEEYILISVMSDVWTIVNELKEHGCKHIMDLGHILNILEQEDMLRRMGRAPTFYPELTKYQNIEKKRKLQFANLGTGIAYYDFSYEKLDISAFNFALPQQSLEFDYKLLRHYEDKFLPESRIAIVLSYCIFLADHLTQVDEINERYYSILPRTEVESRCNTVYASYKERRKLIDKENFVLELKEVHEKRIQEYQVEELLNVWKSQLGILSFEGGVQRPEWNKEIVSSKGWLKKILVLCEEKDWRPVIIVPPMSRMLLDRISTKFRQNNFYNILYEVVGEDILVLDYSQNEEFCHPDLYGTPCFLAKRGAERFTKDVLKKIGLQ